jgi:hypothetical protein
MAFLGEEGCLHSGECSAQAAGRHWFRSTVLSGNQMHPAGRAMMDQAIAERRRVADWLLPHMAEDKAKAFTKEQYRQLALADLGPFSKAAFDHAWISAIEESRRQDWYMPKPRRKETRQ